MKKIISALLVIVFCLALVPSAFAAGGIAKRSEQNFIFDGRKINCEIYNIGDYNYFKLRDLAYLLNGTNNQFAVGWDGETETVTVTTGKAYKPVGGELEITWDKSGTAKVSTQTIIIDGKRVSNLSVYNIGDNNYFKLRDVANYVGYGVEYEEITDTAIVISETDEIINSPRGLTSKEALINAFTDCINGKTEVSDLFEFCFSIAGYYAYWIKEDTSVPFKEAYEAMLDMEKGAAYINRAHPDFAADWKKSEGSTFTDEDLNELTGGNFRDREISRTFFMSYFAVLIERYRMQYAPLSREIVQDYIWQSERNPDMFHYKYSYNRRRDGEYFYELGFEFFEYGGKYFISLPHETMY